MSVLMLLLLLSPCVVFVAMGIPFIIGVVPPNRIYGFRIKRTIEDPQVWYPPNRVAGLWSIGTGIAAAVLSVTFVLGTRFTTAAILVLLPFIGGIAGMYAHVFGVIRQVVEQRERTANGRQAV